MTPKHTEAMAPVEGFDYLDPEHLLAGLDAETRAKIEALDEELPQTQCRQCGTDGCLAYAKAMVLEKTPCNRCAPGGEEGIARLAKVLAVDPLPLDPEYGIEVPVAVARINPEGCIGCGWCHKACPTEAVAGSPKHLYGVMADRCTGCGLCLPACPMDCIEWVETGKPWGKDDRERARTLFNETRVRRSTFEREEKARLEALRHPTQTAGAAKKSDLIAAIMKKARAGRDA